LSKEVAFEVVSKPPPPRMGPVIHSLP